MAMLSISSCASLEARLDKAAEKQGQAEIRVTLPDYPDDCRKQTPHAAIQEGAEALSVLKRERAALDRQNARTARCAAFYLDLKSKLE